MPINARNTEKCDECKYCRSPYKVRVILLINEKLFIEGLSDRVIYSHNRSCTNRTANRLL